MTRVAVVQAGSIPFNTSASIKKAQQFIAESAKNGAELAVFPEAFIGGYPKGASFGASVGNRTVEGRNLFSRYYHAAITIDGPELSDLCASATENNMFILMGIIERKGNTLYCTAVMIDPQKGIVGKHRKLMPTATERLIWGFGDGSTLDVVDSPAGRLGAVICWENYMPMLRQAMYAQGIDIYCAPTADDRSTWLSSMVHIALEGRVSVLSACQVVRAEDYPSDYKFDMDIPTSGYVMHGGSVIVAPSGEILAGPIFDEETILFADLDADEKIRSHLDFDAVGHYSRSDVFQLKVSISPLDPVAFQQE